MTEPASFLLPIRLPGDINSRREPRGREDVRPTVDRPDDGTSRRAAWDRTFNGLRTRSVRPARVDQHWSASSYPDRGADRIRRSPNPVPRQPNQASSIYQDKDGRWHGRVSVGDREDGRPDRKHVRVRIEPRSPERFVASRQSGPTLGRVVTERLRPAGLDHESKRPAGSDIRPVILGGGYGTPSPLPRLLLKSQCPKML